MSAPERVGLGAMPLGAVADGLAAVMAQVSPAGPGRWSATWRRPGLPVLRALAADDFLQLAMDVPEAERACAWDWLRAHADLGGFVKWACTPTGIVSLRAEIPRIAGGDAPLRLAEACEALARAYLREPRASGPGAPGSRVAESGVGELCAAAGWPCASQRDARWRVPLETRRAPYSAVLQVDQGRLRVSTELTDWETLSPTARAALAAYLVAVNAVVRLVRAAVTEDASGGAAHLEAVFETPPSAGELALVFEALSVGADLCGLEAAVLQHDAAAQLFLTGTGWPPSACERQPTP